MNLMFYEFLDPEQPVTEEKLMEMAHSALRKQKKIDESTPKIALVMTKRHLEDFKKIVEDQYLEVSTRYSWDMYTFMDWLAVTSNMVELYSYSFMGVNFMFIVRRNDIK